MTVRCIMPGRALAAAALLWMPLAAAQAAELPLKTPSYKAPASAPPGWTGWYVGVNAGYGFGSSTVSFTGATAAALPAAGLPRSLSVSPKGVLAGVQLGYNWQWGNFVFGPEVDFDYAGIKGSATASGTVGPVTTTLTAEQRIDWFGTARARAGYVLWRDWLFYATGGLAFGHTKLSSTLTSTAGLNAAASASKTALGYTLGGGAEYALFEYWTVKGEYLYYDIGTMKASYPAPLVLTASAPFRGHILRVGVNYRF